MLTNEQQTTATSLRQGMDSMNLPPHMASGVVAWVLFGQKPGQFLTALIENNLLEAARRADAGNGPALQAWVKFLDAYVPSPCYGSVQAVNEWQSRAGLFGRQTVERHA